MYISIITTILVVILQLTSLVVENQTLMQIFLITKTILIFITLIIFGILLGLENNNKYDNFHHKHVNIFLIISVIMQIT